MNATAVIVGIDEAGRAPLAGPVAAGACVIPHSLFRRRLSFNAWSPDKRKHDDEYLIADSKKLSPEQRERAFEWIVANCPHGIAMTDAATIDRIGILAATERAMQLAIRTLSEFVTPTYVLVDGRDKFWFDYPKSSIIGGDGLEPCIAAASILAKVTRDRLMIEWAKEYPGYGFELHKGYPTPAHYDAIKKRGICTLHRQSFLKNILNPQSAPMGRKRMTSTPVAATLF